MTIPPDWEQELKAALAAQNLATAMRLALKLGDAFSERGQFDRALNSFTLSARLCQELGDASHLIPVLYKLSATYVKLGQVNKAILRIKRGLELSQNAKDDWHLAQFWALLGDAHTMNQQEDEALVDYQEALKLLPKLSAWDEAGRVAGKLATLYMDSAHYTEATLILAQAVSFFEQAGKPDLQARALGNLGTAFGKLGRWTEAGKRHMLALKLARNIGDSEEEAYQLANLGYVAEMDGHIQWAVIYYRQALYLAIVANDHQRMGNLAVDIARLLLAQDIHLNQVIVLLEATRQLDTVPPETQTLLDQAWQRHRLLVSQGVILPPAITHLKTYAEQAWRQR